MKSQLINLRPLHRLFPLLKPLPAPGLRHCHRHHSHNRSRTALGGAGSYHDVVPPIGEDGFIHIAVLEHLQYGGHHRRTHPLHSKLQPEQGCVRERWYLHWVHVLHVRRHRPHSGDLAPEPRGSGRRQPLYQHQVLRCVDGGRRDFEAVSELEDAADGPGGIGQHLTPSRPKRYGDGIPLTRPTPSMGWGWEIYLYTWDGNGIGVAPPKPAPLPILQTPSLGWCLFVFLFKFK